MKKILITALLGILLLSSSCRKDKKDVLFEMTYPNLTFEVLPGISGSQALVFSFPAIESNIDDFLSQHNLSRDDIGSIHPIRAKIESTDGRSYYFVEEAEIRVCSTEQLDCEPLFDQAFKIDQLNGSASTFIDLIPGLQDKTDLLTSEYFKLEVILFLRIGDITPYNVKSRVAVTFEALK